MTVSFVGCPLNEQTAALYRQIRSLVSPTPIPQNANTNNNNNSTRNFPRKLHLLNKKSHININKQYNTTLEITIIGNAHKTFHHFVSLIPPELSSSLTNENLILMESNNQSTLNISRGASIEVSFVHSTNHDTPPKIQQYHNRVEYHHFSCIDMKLRFTDIDEYFGHRIPPSQINPFKHKMILLGNCRKMKTLWKRVQGSVMLFRQEYDTDNDLQRKLEVTILKFVRSVIGGHGANALTAKHNEMNTLIEKRKNVGSLLDSVCDTLALRGKVVDELGNLSQVLQDLLRGSMKGDAIVKGLTLEEEDILSQENDGRWSLRLLSHPLPSVIRDPLSSYILTHQHKIHNAHNKLYGLSQILRLIDLLNHVFVNYPRILNVPDHIVMACYSTIENGGVLAASSKVAEYLLQVYLPPIIITLYRHFSLILSHTLQIVARKPTQDPHEKQWTVWKTIVNIISELWETQIEASLCKCLDELSLCTPDQLYMEFTNFTDENTVVGPPENFDYLEESVASNSNNISRESKRMTIKGKVVGGHRLASEEEEELLKKFLLSPQTSTNPKVGTSIKTVAKKIFYVAKMRLADTIKTQILHLYSILKENVYAKVLEHILSCPDSKIEGYFRVDHLRKELYLEATQLDTNIIDLNTELQQIEENLYHLTWDIMRTKEIEEGENVAAEMWAGVWSRYKETWTKNGDIIKKRKSKHIKDFKFEHFKSSEPEAENKLITMQKIVRGFCAKRLYRRMKMMNKKRSFIMREIYETEKNYLSWLEIIIRVFLEPMRTTIERGILILAHPNIIEAGEEKNYEPDGNGVHSHLNGNVSVNMNGNATMNGSENQNQNGDDDEMNSNHYNRGLSAAEIRIQANKLRLQFGGSEDGIVGEIFGNIDDIYRCHKKFLFDLETRLGLGITKINISRKGNNDPIINSSSNHSGSAEFPRIFDSHTKVADLFLNMEKTHQPLYSVYAQKFLRSRMALHQHLTSSSSFANFLRRSESDPECKDQDLASLLIMPIQRLPRYCLLVKSLLENTWTGHIEYSRLVKAEETLRKITHFVNDHRKESEARGDTDKMNKIAFSLPMKGATIATRSSKNGMSSSRSRGALPDFSGGNNSLYSSSDPTQVWRRTTVSVQNM